MYNEVAEVHRSQFPVIFLLAVRLMLFKQVLLNYYLKREINNRIGMTSRDLLM